jgi:hypothetical protein
MVNVISGWRISLAIPDNFDIEQLGSKILVNLFKYVKRLNSTKALLRTIIDFIIFMENFIEN